VDESGRRRKALAYDRTRLDHRRMTIRSAPRLDPLPVPPHAPLPTLRRVAAECTRCDLYARATQTVFGAGPARAAIMLVGEQPGDEEDRQGAPFVGPAGRLLDRALGEAGVDRDRVYVTNVVKHFKWKPSGGGKRRLHEKPRDDEVEACLAWLDAEIAAVRPKLVVCLGATAAQALLGKKFRVTRQHGETITLPNRPPIMATFHPSAILRAPDDEARRAALALLVADLAKLRRVLAAA
jgi:DNA polymerase